MARAVSRNAAGQHEGLATWTRERDNRYWALCSKRDRVGVEGLTRAEEDELEVLEVDNKEFIELGLKYQRGGGIKTMDSVFVLLGYAIGLGNVWRFPYLAGKFGGLSFILAYLACTVLIAHPVYLLELAYGQTMKKSTVFVFMDISLKWTGVGLACVFAMMVVQSYYTVLLSYCLYYMYKSFSSPLPWEQLSLGMANATITGNGTDEFGVSAERYWRSNVLGQDPLHPYQLGEVQHHLVFGLIFAYMIIYLAVFRGIQVGVKLTYVTVLAPALVILVISIRCLFLEGAGTGLVFFLGRFSLSSFFNPVMWAEAAAQTLFSVLFMPGTTITLASYMQDKEDIFRINQIVVSLNAFYSLLAGVAVFSILGYIENYTCHTHTLYQCRKVEDLAQTGGPGLAFVALAEGIAVSGGGSANVFAFSFFGMLFLLGLDTSFAGIETLVTYIEDGLVYYGHRGYRREWTSLILILTLFTLGLVYCTSSGVFTLEVVDHYVTTYVILIVAMLECTMLVTDVTWDVLATNVQLATTGLDHINNGRGRELPRFLKRTICYFTPAACLFFTVTLFISDCVEAFGKSSGRDYPTSYHVAGWCLLVANLVIMAYGGYWKVRQNKRLHRDPSGVEMTQQRKGDIESPLLDDNVNVDANVDANNTVNSNERAHSASASKSAPPVHPINSGTGRTAAMRAELEKLGAEALEQEECATEGSISE